MTKKKYKKKTSEKHAKADHSHKKEKPESSIIVKPVASQRTTRSATQAANNDIKKPITDIAKEPKANKDEDYDSDVDQKSFKQPAAKPTAAIDESDYKKMQDTHIQSLERERKYSKNKKLREQNKPKEYDSSEDEKSDDKDKAIDMRKEDAELEKILRDYNTEVRQKRVKKIYLEKPFDLPYYKGIQIPKHLKWITIYSRTNESVLMQEIEALELELMRLKESKVIHKEFRRFAQMPLCVMSKPCTCCRKWEKKKHWCSHQFCIKPCRKQDEVMTKGNKEGPIQSQFQNENMNINAEMNPIGVSPIVIPVYPAGIPQGGVKRQRGRPKKIKPDDPNEGGNDQNQQHDSKDNQEFEGGANPELDNAIIENDDEAQENISEKMDDIIEDNEMIENNDVN